VQDALVEFQPAQIPIEQRVRWPNCSMWRCHFHQLVAGFIKACQEPCEKVPDTFNLAGKVL
jgi:hypothetical protein